MSDRLGLQPIPLEPSRAQLASLEAQLASREQLLAATSLELQQLQSKYLVAVGGFYAELVKLDAAIADAEIKAGLRPPRDSIENLDEDDSADADADADQPAGAGCSHRGAPSSNLKSIFRNLARTIHPDLALNEPARWRRHSLMAEANRAYAERDEDRLRLIMHAWERSPESVLGDDEDATDLRVRRRIAQIEDRLLAIDTELADLRSSAIGQLKRKIDEAKAKKWDLFAEMVLEVKREVERTTARLASLAGPAGTGR